MAFIETNNLKGDIFGGITAGIVALPLALAFGIQAFGSVDDPAASSKVLWQAWWEPPCWASLPHCLAEPIHRSVVLRGR